MTDTSAAVRLLNLGATNWLRTQSVYRATASLLEPDQPDTMVLCTPLHPYVAVGSDRQPESLMELSVCRTLNVPVVTSPLSAPLTCLDSGASLWQWVFHGSDPEPMVSLMVSGALTMLAELGIRSLHTEDRQLMVGDRVLMDTQQGRLGEATVVQGDIFLKIDGNLMEQLSGENSRRIGLWQVLPRPISPEAIFMALLSGFERALGRSIKRGTPRQVETRTSKQIDLLLLEEAGKFLKRPVVIE